MIYNKGGIMDIFIFLGIVAAIGILAHEIGGKK